MLKECGKFKKLMLFKFFYKINIGVKVFKSFIFVFFGGIRYNVIIKKENIIRVYCRVIKMKYLKKIMVYLMYF